MKPEQIRAIALEVARELLDEPLNIGQAEHYTDFATRFLSAITEQAEPVGYIDAEQLRRWDVLRGTKFESEERCYMPFSKTLYQTGLSDCSLPVFTHPPFEQERCASVSAKFDRGGQRNENNEGDPL